MSYNRNNPTDDQWLEATAYLNYEFLEPDQQRDEVLNQLKQKLLSLLKAQIKLVETDIERAVQHQMLIAAAERDMGTNYVLHDLLMTLYGLEK
jgi:hypothetical protein